MKSTPIDYLFLSEESRLTFEVTVYPRFPVLPYEQETCFGKLFGLKVWLYEENFSEPAGIQARGKPKGRERLGRLRR